MKINKVIQFAALLVIVTAVGCKGRRHKHKNDSMMSASNPFFAVSKLPFQTAAFDKIKTSDFKPALEEGMKQQLAEVQKIADSAAQPTFKNTLEALETSGQLLRRVSGVFQLLSGANTNPELQSLQEEEAPKFAATNDAIFLNTKLYKRVEAIYKQRAKLKLDQESNRLVEYYYQKFELAGAKLSDADKETLKKLNKEEASLSAKYTNQLMAAAKAGTLVVDNKADLAGLSDGAIDAAAQAAKDAKMPGKWIIKLQNTTTQPALQSLSVRATRQKLFEASWNRAEKKDSNDTRATISQIALLRAKKAKLIGFPNFATWQLQDQMAKKPEAVEKFLTQLLAPTGS